MKAFLVMIQLTFVSLTMAFNTPEKTPVPNWVVDITPTLVTPDSIGGSAHYLLIDYQYHLSRQTRFVHYATQVLNSQGVQDESALKINYDPTYQSLNIHAIKIIRANQVIDKLMKTSVETMRRESSQDVFIYDGTLTAFVHIDDVRPNDIIEYSYSIEGFNPVNKGNYAGIFYQEFGAPVGQIYHRIVTDDLLPIYIQYNNDAAKPVKKTIGKETNYTWNLKNVSKIEYDSNVPYWYNPEKSVDVSTYQSWKEVAKWASNLYTYNRRSIDKILNQFDLNLPKETLILNFIRYVQDEVRYLGLENGISAYTPHDPIDVFNQKYGDCKDKSLLLVALLRKIDIKANPLLVNTKLAASILDRQPAHNVFNHCVVQFIHDGQYFYVDPTISNQGGDIYHMSFPSYYYGLPVHNTADKLIKLPMRKTPQVHITELIDIKKIGGRATAQIRSKFSGSKADDIRAYFSSNASRDIEKNYLDFYSFLYPEIKLADEIQFEDNLRSTSNEIIVVEQYELSNPWVTDDSSLIYFESYPLVLESWTDFGRSSTRTMPYYLGAPFKYYQKSLITYPEEILIEEQRVQVNHESFSYSAAIEGGNKQVGVIHEYELNQNVVSADQSKDFFDKMNRVKENFSFIISYEGAGQRSGISWYAVLFAVVVLLLSTWLLYRLHNSYDPTPKEVDTDKPIGGWLILPAIGLTVTPFFLLYELYSIGFFELSMWTAWSDQVIEKVWPLFALITGELLFNCALLAYSIFVIIQFYQRRSSAPRFICLFYIIAFLIPLLDHLLSSVVLSNMSLNFGDEPPYRELGGAFFRALLWVPVFTFAERVHDTFTKTIDPTKQKIKKLVSKKVFDQEE